MNKKDQDAIAKLYLESYPTIGAERNWKQFTKKVTSTFPNFEVKDASYAGGRVNGILEYSARGCYIEARLYYNTLNIDLYCNNENLNEKYRESQEFEFEYDGIDAAYNYIVKLVNKVKNIKRDFDFDVYGDD